MIPVIYEVQKRRKKSREREMERTKKVHGDSRLKDNRAPHICWEVVGRRWQNLLVVGEIEFVGSDFSNESQCIVHSSISPCL
jgi:hypothetical protein